MPRQQAPGWRQPLHQAWPQLKPIPLEVLLAVGRFDPAHTVLPQTEDDDSERHEHHQAHGHAGEMFDTWSYESDQPFSIEALREMVRKELPASIYRCKGIVLTKDSPGKRFALQAVGRRVELVELDDWGERTPKSQLVAIGSSFDDRELSRKFDSCLVQAQATNSPIEAETPMNERGQT